MSRKILWTLAFIFFTLSTGHCGRPVPICNPLILSTCEPD